MALTALEIYKHLPKTNCRECGSTTCLAFAMCLASKKSSLEECPYITEEAKLILESASAPPIKLISIGSGENKLEIGNETVLFRHEETFYRPPGIAILIEDILTEEEINEKIEQINKLQFERVGQKIQVNLIAIKNTSLDVETYLKVVEKVINNSSLLLILISESIEILEAALKICNKQKPLLYKADEKNFEKMVELAKKYSVPLAVKTIEENSLEKLSLLVEKIVNSGFKELVLDSQTKNLTSNLFNLTQIRRLSLKKNYRLLGYPTIMFTQEVDPYLEANEVVTYICKYASIVVIKNIFSWQILPLLTLRQNIYSDPQKPIQVEAKIYPIGNPNQFSPIIITTNFSLTYFTVEGDVEASRIPSYIVVVDTEGQSVLTAWAAEKFTPEIITSMINKCGIGNLVSHRKIIIPGYVAVLSGKLEEISGWKVLVGPRESSNIPAFLKTRWKEEVK